MPTGGNQLTDCTAEKCCRNERLYVCVDCVGRVAQHLLTLLVEVIASNTAQYRGKSLILGQLLTLSVGLRDTTIHSIKCLHFFKKKLIKRVSSSINEHEHLVQSRVTSVLSELQSGSTYAN